ncbi:MAG: ATPase [Pirellulaceae bacterium]|nr:MAG: ATPase [Pirellulaceae bacterium]
MNASGLPELNTPIDQGRIASTQRLAIRLLAPMVVGAVVASLVVAVVALIYGQAWAKRDVEHRFIGIRDVLSRSPFPLTAPVLESLAGLTATELVLIDPQLPAPVHTLEGEMTDRELEALSGSLPVASSAPVEEFRVSLHNHEFLAYRFARFTPGSDRGVWLYVLFDQATIRTAGLRVAAWPIAAGVSTVVIVSCLAWFSTARLVTRLARLQHHVGRIAQGDFTSRLTDTRLDEIGRLIQSVNSMAEQLHALWQQLARQNSEQILHRIATGLAHQLRNTLTGARLALELSHARGRRADDEEVQVALRQIAFAEEYVGRLLKLGTQPVEQQPRAEFLCRSMHDLKAALNPMAKHLRVTITWDLSAIEEEVMIEDGPGFYAAISNLVINAMQAGNEVFVGVSVAPGIAHVEVTDNGPGIAAEVQQRVFEPFVTTKAEGLGLGLSLVQRLAGRMGGTVSWERREGKTRFHFTCRVRTVAASRQAATTAHGEKN